MFIRKNWQVWWLYIWFSQHERHIGSSSATDIFPADIFHVAMHRISNRILYSKSHNNVLFYLILSLGYCDANQTTNQPTQWEFFLGSHSYPNCSRNSRHFMCLGVHYHIHNILSFAHILSHISTVHYFFSCFYNIHFSIILLSMFLSSKWLLTFSFSCQNIVCISVDPVRATW